MYAEADTGWSRQKLASVALSVCLNFGIFAGFAMYTQLGGINVGKQQHLAVFALGGEGAEAQQEAAPPPAPPPPPPPHPQPHESTMEAPELVLLPKPAPPEDHGAETPSAAQTPLSIEPSRPATHPHEIPRPAKAAQQPRAHEQGPSPEPASAPSSAGSASAASGGEGDAYGASVYAHLMRYRTSNVVGPGDVRIRLTIAADGSARDTSVVRSSGSSRFDREALRMVRRASPFPRPPGGTSRTFDFGIRGS